MRKSWMTLGIAAMVLGLWGAPVSAADQSGATATAADELGKRSKPEAGNNGGLSDSAVRVMMTYAFSLVKGPDGKPIQVDEADQSKLEKYAIPGDSARRVIRAATRSAYADVCGLYELGAANYRAMMAQEESLQQWTPEQRQMIDALYLFAISYFTGNATITEDARQAGGEGSPANQGAAGTRQIQTPAAPQCPPEQKKKVENAINAYVASVGIQ